MVRRLASSFLAAQGPTKVTLMSRPSLLLARRAVSTMGVMAMLMFWASSGNSFLAITLQLGQQLVAMKG